MHDEITIGARLRALRRWRGMTLAQLGGQAELSVSFLSMAERGLRTLDRRSHITALANALRVSETELTGGPHLGTDRVQSDPHLCVPALRSALMTNALGYGLVDQTRPLPELTTEVRAMEKLRRDDDYTKMGTQLPAVLDELYSYVADPADEAAQRTALYLLLDATHYASIICKNLSYPDLAHGASERGLAVALMLDDPVAIGKAHFPLVLNTPREGAWNRVVTLAERAANQLEPHARDGEGLQVLGMLALNAALAAAAVNDADRAESWLDQAGQLARHVPDDPASAWQQFSRTNVAVWRITVGVEAGLRGGAVYELAQKVDKAKLVKLPYRMAGFLSDTGRGLARDPKTQPIALEWLRKAEAAAPQRIRNNQRVRESIAVMLEQARVAAVGRELRGMAARMGVPH
ncbi:helix-turn-helix domain-containing protein [Actinomadura sp. 3N407]|uniref:helix-turn-helix domain-containing protein n=1 Tax=Actinomadura sp. 3N407 TaxID=3457423 RepID=UPI003FCC70D1